MTAFINGIVESELRDPKIAVFTKADVTAAGATAWTVANSPLTIFTVTGDCYVRCMAKIVTGLTSTANNGTLELGFAGDTASLLVQDVVDATAFATGDVWSFLDAADDPAARVVAQWVFMAAGTDIILTVGTNNMTAGAMTLYCEYVPVNATGAVVSA